MGGVCGGGGGVCVCFFFFFFFFEYVKFWGVREKWHFANITAKLKFKSKNPFAHYMTHNLIVIIYHTPHFVFVGLYFFQILRYVH